MKTFDEILAGSPKIDHPKLAKWRKLLAVEGSTALVTIERIKDGLYFQNQVIHITFFEGNHRIGSDHVEWLDDINEALMEMHVRAVSVDNEAVRFGLSLRVSLMRPERVFGDGFYNTALLRYFRDSEFATEEHVASVLSGIQRPDSNVAPGAYKDCSEMISGALSMRAHQLIGTLRYSNAEARDIMTCAVAQYLDERFSVSNRRMLGWH